MGSLCNEFPALLWTVERFDGSCYFYPARDCPGWEHGSVCARIQREIPMTEDTGWSAFPEPAAPEPVPELAAAPEPAPAADPQPEPEPAEAASEPQDATPLPDVNADPQEVAEQAAAAEPDHVPPPFVPDQGVAEWLREALHELHRRLRALGG